MALVLKDRVKETTTSTGTGTITLAGAATGFQSFAAIGNANTTYYVIAGQGTSEWEVGIGTYTSAGTTLSRTTVLASSNAGSLVTFSAGTKDVFVTYPSGKSVNLDASGNVSLPGQLSLVNTALTSSGTSNLDIGGPLSFSDTGIISDFVATTNGYLQAVLQNKSNGAAASAEWIVYNDQGTASTNFATMGINSSGYTGTGSINAAGYGYFLTGSTDLVLGTIGANAIHFVVNTGATDAMTINASKAIAVNGLYGISGQVLTSAGSSAPPTWGTIARYLEIIAVASATALANATNIIGTVEIPIAGTITNIRARTTSGTCTVTFNINGSSIGTVNATSSGVSTSVSSAVSALAALTLDVSSASGSGLLVTVTIG